jgi:hypothetical protein
MDVLSQCMIVRAIGRSAYSSKQNTQKKQLYSVSVKSTLSKSLYIVCKINLYL